MLSLTLVSKLILTMGLFQLRWDRIIWQILAKHSLKSIYWRITARHWIISNSLHFSVFFNCSSVSTISTLEESIQLVLWSCQRIAVLLLPVPNVPYFSPTYPETPTNQWNKTDSHHKSSRKIIKLPFSAKICIIATAEKSEEIIICLKYSPTSLVFFSTSGGKNALLKSFEPNYCHFECKCGINFSMENFSHVPKIWHLKASNKSDNEILCKRAYFTLGSPSKDGAKESRKCIRVYSIP